MVCRMPSSWLSFCASNIFSAARVLLASATSLWTRSGSVPTRQYITSPRRPTSTCAPRGSLDMIRSIIPKSLRCESPREAWIRPSFSSVARMAFTAAKLRDSGRRYSGRLAMSVGAVSQTKLPALPMSLRVTATVPGPKTAGSCMPRVSARCIRASTNLPATERVVDVSSAAASCPCTFSRWSCASSKVVWAMWAERNSTE
ncbi:hypothetical protein B0H17DRAFT_1076318 [Mycena rosella]|uniref:Secreted protein n=1 Tax=Mycena rosella TaxID=1033263 RepID=A0AAD7D6G6_MYCRO|nr:hypothetical protein B0H17DRAFT_1076318 [Mycena rosella]